MKIMLNRMVLNVVRDLEHGDKGKILLRCLPHKPTLILSKIFLLLGAYIMKCHKIKLTTTGNKQRKTAVGRKFLPT